MAEEDGTALDSESPKSMWESNKALEKLDNIQRGCCFIHPVEIRRQAVTKLRFHSILLVVSKALRRGSRCFSKSATALQVYCISEVMTTLGTNS